MLIEMTCLPVSDAPECVSYALALHGLHSLFPGPSPISV